MSWTVWPTFTLGEDGLTTTLATGVGAIVTDAVPLFPSIVAVMVTVPAATPVTTPLAFTVASAVLLLDHPVIRL